MDVIKGVIQKKQSNCKGLIVLETNVRDDVKLTTGNKKETNVLMFLKTSAFWK